MKTVNKSLVAVLLGMAFVLFAFPLSAQSNSASDDSTQSSVSSLDLEKSITFTDDVTSSVSTENASSRKNSSGIGIFIRMVLVLILIVGLIYGVFWFIKKKTNVVTNDDDYLRRVAAINVAPGKSVQVVTLIDKAYLIGVTDDSITLLGEINDDELIKAMNLSADKKANIKKPLSFSEVLDMFLIKNNKTKSVFSDSEQKVDQMFTQQEERS
ncbi:MAG: flagellar biosynthetic protein FliO [Treponema sp.]|nr:flagellar biosynthetic protein FliO [Treponema sp.]